MQVKNWLLILLYVSETQHLRTSNDTRVKRNWTISGRSFRVQIIQTDGTNHILPSTGLQRTWSLSHKWMGCLSIARHACTPTLTPNSSLLNCVLVDSRRRPKPNKQNMWTPLTHCKGQDLKPRHWRREMTGWATEPLQNELATSGYAALQCCDSLPVRVSSPAQSWLKWLLFGQREDTFMFLNIFPFHTVYWLKMYYIL